MKLLIKLITDELVNASATGITVHLHKDRITKILSENIFLSALADTQEDILHNMIQDAKNERQKQAEDAAEETRLAKLENDALVKAANEKIAKRSKDANKIIAAEQIRRNKEAAKAQRAFNPNHTRIKEKNS